MAKKKKARQQTFLSPDKYVREKARSLEIGECFVTEDVGESGLVEVVVTRLHKGGKRTFGAYLIDKFCLGVKDAFFNVRMEETDYEDFIKSLKERYILRKISYNEAHNLVYGAIAFAEEAGIQPCADFSLAKYVLEEDTDDVPLIQYDFGKDGRHLLVAHNQSEADLYLPVMRANLGSDFSYMIGDEPDVEADDYEYDPVLDDEIMKRLEEVGKMSRPYSYKHPQYPFALHVENQSVLLTLCDPDNADRLDDNLLDEILSLPKDSLRKDLENILLFNIGLSCDGIPDEMSDGPFSGVIGHCVMLLAEVGNDSSSLDAVLEVLRQDDEFYDYHIGDLGVEIFSPTIYKLAGKRLDALMDFMKEPGIVNLRKSYISHAVSQLALADPDRREEVIGWFGRLLADINRDFPSAAYADPMLNGLLVCDLMELDAMELLPEIKTMYDNGFVLMMLCSDFQEVEKEMLERRHHSGFTLTLDIHDRYARLGNMFEQPLSNH